MTRPKHSARQASVDGSIDEVGFGAHIDKSVAAAGDNVTLVAYQTTAYPYIYGSTQLNAYRVSSP